MKTRGGAKTQPVRAIATGRPEGETRVAACFDPGPRECARHRPAGEPDGAL